MNGIDEDFIKILASTSAILSGVSIAIGSIILMIFYQNRTFGNLEIARLWLDIFQLCMASFFLFGITHIISFIHLNFQKMHSKKRIFIAQISYIGGWLILFLIAYLLRNAAKFAGNIIGG